MSINPGIIMMALLLEIQRMSINPGIIITILI
jgi:hypothetical protein